MLLEEAVSLFSCVTLGTNFFTYQCEAQGEHNIDRLGYPCMHQLIVHIHTNQFYKFEASNIGCRLLKSVSWLSEFFFLKKSFNLVN